jgi:hypothetical protein
VNYPVQLSFDSNDRLIDLRLAVLESQLDDTYEGVCIQVDHNQIRSTVVVQIGFENQDDQLHWLMSHPNHRSQLDYMLI